MDLEIGPTLREARMRRRIDLTEVEARTKIRVRYLRALENEEWGILPEAAYTRSFIRTYATYLGLDGERMADAFRRQHDAHAATRYPHVEPVRPANERARRIRMAPSLSPEVLGGLVVVVLVALLVVLGLTGGSDDEAAPSQSQSNQGNGAQGGPGTQPSPPALPQDVQLSLSATGEVWVCLVAGTGEELVDGQTLTAGSQEGPFRASRFLVTFGNGQMEMAVNGRPSAVAETSNPVGYEIRPGRVRELDASERPTCQ